MSAYVHHNKLIWSELVLRYRFEDVYIKQIYNFATGPCQSGEWSVSGLQPCEPCPVGSYTSMSGSTSCEKCDNATTTVNNASQQQQDCVGQYSMSSILPWHSPWCKI